jgi:D-serine deaminase-like pyridoxal phosphate-dependent protein
VLELKHLETPTVVVDMNKVRDNLKDMAESVASFGCSLRPHVKTHKIAELARLQLQYGANGITCAKVSEAEVMANGGIQDIFIAYPLVGDFRIRRAVELSRRIRLILAVDSFHGAKALSEAAVNSGTCLEVRMEVDTGLKRTGVPYHKASETAHSISELPGLKLTGIYTFRGLIYDGKPTDDNSAAGRQEGELLAALAVRLRNEGLDIRDVSGGSSPTGKFVAQVPGVTEVRPGTYIFQDIMQVKERACSENQCAAFVLATVVSTPEDGYAIVDGGSKTYGTDFQINSAPFYYEGYGYVADNPDLILSRVNEEHGIITSKSGCTGLKVGQKICITPVHICSTVNLHNYVWLMDGEQLRKVVVDARGMLI